MKATATLAAFLLLSSTPGTDHHRPSPEEIIAAFVEKETEFKKLWQQYTYTQNVLIEELGPGNTVRGRRELTIEVYFTNDGQRRTRTVSDRGRLATLRVTPQDIDNAVHLQPFVLTEEDVADYKIEYVGEERVDELDTYVFDLKPRRKRAGKSYFKGRIWVDQVDLQIVMSRGKPVPQSDNNRFPEFETLREQIDGKNWFPTWTEADDYLRFPGRRNPVHIYQLITYRDFKRFGVSASIRYGEPQVPEKP